MEASVAVIGTGNMGGALARGICKSVHPERMWLANRTREKALALAEELGCNAAESNAEAFLKADYTFLCVKPHLVASVLEEIAEEARFLWSSEGELFRVLLGENKALVSVAAGLRADRLTEYLERLLREKLGDADVPRIPVAHIMPNTCVAIGRGITAVSTPTGEDEKLYQDIRMLLMHTGTVKWIDESLMDQFTAVAGCGPAYVYPYIEALADGGVAAGLPRALAVECAAQTVLGAAAMVLESGKHPGQLKDEVCSPGGSTIAGVAELERGGLRAAAINAVLAAWRRGAELGK